MPHASFPALNRQLILRVWPRLPHFLVLGTQKGGTTSLHRLLSQHPKVFLPECKEVHYFSLHDNQSLRWYSEHYLTASPYQLRGDITPYYLFHPRAPKQIRKTLPQAKLIVLLRNPVERTLSQVFHAQRHGFETLNLEAALTAEVDRLNGANERLRARGSIDFNHQKHSYMSRSRYEEQLDRYEALFPRRQILILRSEDLFENTEQSWEQILRFLGLEKRPLPGRLERVNAGRGEAELVPKSVRAKLEQELGGTFTAMKERYNIDWD